MSFEEELMQNIWELHLSNKDHKHELKQHFCRACCDLVLESYKQRVSDVIDNFQSKKKQITDKILILSEMKEEIKKELGLK